MNYTPQVNVQADVCNGCGAWVSDQDKQVHDNFHEALASLWATK